MTTQPRAQAVLPVRNASASSMQSPPASAEATSVEILIAGIGSAWRIAQVQAPVNQLGQTQVQGEGGRKDQPGIGHQAMIVEGDADAVGLVAWQHLVS